MMSFADYLRTGTLAPFRLGMPKSDVLACLVGDRRFGAIHEGTVCDMVCSMSMFLQMFFGDGKLCGVGLYFCHGSLPKVRRVIPDVGLLRSPTRAALVDLLIKQQISFRVNFKLDQLNLITEGDVHCCFQGRRIEKALSFEGGCGF